MSPDSKFNSTTWWVIGLSGVLAGSLSRSLLLLSLISGGALLILWVKSHRTVESSGLRIFGLSALVALSVRVFFRVVFSSGLDQEPLFFIPRLSIHFAGSTISLLGPVTSLELWAGIADGLRMAAIVLSIGVAATMADNRSLLRRAPSALQEFATAAAIAINMAPQLVSSLARIRKSQRLRGNLKGARGFAENVTPLLEDSLSQSMNLAASMESRGFGRTGALRPKTLWASRLSSFMGISLLAIATYTLLATTAHALWPLGIAVLGLAMIAASLRIGTLHRVRTFYDTEPPTKADLVARFASLGALAIVLILHFNSFTGWSWLA